MIIAFIDIRLFKQLSNSRAQKICFFFVRAEKMNLI